METTNRPTLTIPVRNVWDLTEMYSEEGRVYAPIAVGSVVEEWVFLDERGGSDTRYSLRPEGESATLRPRHAWNNRISWGTRLLRVVSAPTPRAFVPDSADLGDDYGPNPMCVLASESVTLEEI